MSDILDLSALGQVLLIALVGAVGVVVFFSLGLLGAVSYSHRRESGSPAILSLAAAALCFLICAAAVVLGIWTMLSTK